MIHEAKCTITLESGTIKSFIKPEPPIPTDDQIEQTFPQWKFRVQRFLERCIEEEHKELYRISSSDYFRYGMKFMICESAKLT